MSFAPAASPPEGTPSPSPASSRRIGAGPPATVARSTSRAGHGAAGERGATAGAGNRPGPPASASATETTEPSGGATAPPSLAADGAAWREGGAVLTAPELAGNAGFLRGEGEGDRGTRLGAKGEPPESRLDQAVEDEAKLLGRLGEVGAVGRHRAQKSRMGQDGRGEVEEEDQGQ